MLFAVVMMAAAVVTSCGPTAGDVETEVAAATREVTFPVGTVLHLQLTSGVASDTSHVEEVVNAELTQPLVMNNQNVVPIGAKVTGIVSEADDSDKVKGRARVSVQFNVLSVGGRQHDMRTSGFSRTASATKSEDATKIGVGAGIGAAVGGILGGGKGAAEGALIGGGAGTGLVLATRGKEVRLASGTQITTRLTMPLTVRVAN